MRAIFYDLETSDLNPIGQILGYAFIEVDDRWNVTSKLVGTIKISRLQLPAPGAMLANRLAIFEHHERASDTEREALQKIWRWLSDRYNQSREPIPLCGYNSNSFDLLYLRTSLIRNGLSPYFRGMEYRDLLLVARWLSINEASFPRLPNGEDGKEHQLSLRLETIAHALGVLQGEQSHDAEQDVLLTIAMAKAIHERFGSDVRRFDHYQARAVEDRCLRGAVIQQQEVQYDLREPSRVTETPITLISADNRGALWCDLNRFKKDPSRTSLMYFTRATRALFADGALSADEASLECALAAKRTFADVTISSFFTTSRCDIEQDIYRLDGQARQAIEEAIWRGDRTQLQRIDNRDARSIVIRQRINEYVWGGEHDAWVRKELTEYARYRYGGSFRLDKGADPDAAPRNAPSYQELRSELAERLRAVTNLQQQRILTELSDWYQQSELGKMLNELMPVSVDAAAPPTDRG